jgi:hypothetical protein
MTDIRWGRVALLAPVALALLPLVLVLGPLVVGAGIGLAALVSGDWNAHPGELFGCIICPIVYTVGMVALGVSLYSGGDWLEPVGLVLGSVLLAAVSLLWAAHDYRVRGRRPLT